MKFVLSLLIATGAFAANEEPLTEIQLMERRLQWVESDLAVIRHKEEILIEFFKGRDIKPMNEETLKFINPASLPALAVSSAGTIASLSRRKLGLAFWGVAGAYSSVYAYTFSNRELYKSDNGFRWEVYEALAVYGPNALHEIQLGLMGAEQARTSDRKKIEIELYNLIALGTAQAAN